MLEILKEIEHDINRCKNVITENNYLEIVIAIEEIQDKYKDKIKNINENSNEVVWNYSKKDLEKIENHLEEYKKDLVLKEKLKSIDDKIGDLKLYLKDAVMENKEVIISILHNMELVNSKDITLDEKYEELRDYLEYMKNLDRSVNIYLLEILLLIIK